MMKNDADTTRFVGALGRQIGVLKDRQNRGCFQTEGEFVSALASAVEVVSLLLSEDDDSKSSSSCDPTTLISMLTPNYLTDSEAHQVLSRIPPHSSIDSKPQGSPSATNAPPISQPASPLKDSARGNAVQNIMDLPDHLIRTIFGFLSTMDSISIFPVCKTWREFARKTEIMMIDNISTECFCNSINEALLFAARNLEVHRLAVRDFGQDDLRVNFLVLDNFFWSVPCRLVAVSLELQAEIHGSDLLGLSRHVSLEMLKLAYFTFPSMEKVAKMLCPLKQLKVLSLEIISFSDDEHGWNDTDCLNEVLRELCDMRDLSIKFHRLTDEGLASILRGLQQLRRLDLGCTWRRAGDSLTDKSVQEIITNCPKLQYLSVSGHSQVTLSAIKVLLRSCPIRELNIWKTAIQPCDFRELVEASTTLLVLRFSFLLFGRRSQQFEGEEVQNVNEAIKACQGRVIFVNDVGGKRYEVPDIFPQSVVNQQQETAKIFNEIFRSLTKVGYSPT
jgi:hypothetical protein